MILARIAKILNDQDDPKLSQKLNKIDFEMNWIMSSVFLNSILILRYIYISILRISDLQYSSSKISKHASSKFRMKI